MTFQVFITILIQYFFIYFTLDVCVAKCVAQVADGRPLYKCNLSTLEKVRKPYCYIQETKHNYREMSSLAKRKKVFTEVKKNMHVLKITALKYVRFSIQSKLHNQTSAVNYRDQIDVRLTDKIITAHILNLRSIDSLN